MANNSSEAFKSAILQRLTFHKYENDRYSLYTNKNRPELGYLISYSREGYYDFGIADYTIPEDFSLSFDNPEQILRFGIVYHGITEFEIEEHQSSSFTPSTFFVIEKDLKGSQTWRKGQHYHGVELTIYDNYLKEVIDPGFPGIINAFDAFNRNFTYVYLPLEIPQIIHRLQSLAYENSLTGIYLEAKLLECIALLTSEISKSAENAFTNQINYGNIKIGKNRIARLTASDIHALQKAHDILTEHYSYPPGIEALGKMVFLNPQKLKAGFSKQYHMSIGEYTNHLRMTTAANLLSTTDLSIENIANKVGYHYSANFSKMFQKTYGMTPLRFRKTK